jgi:GWxTD domain-containing protein
MRLKIIILFILLALIFNKNSFSQQKDTLFDLKIADINQIPFKDMDFPFFDIDKNQIFISFSVKNSTDSNYISIEIKKNTIQQSRLKPIVQKKILLHSDNKIAFVDSLDISNYLISGNYDIIVSLVSKQLEIISSIKKGFQTIRNGKAIIKTEFEDNIASNNINIQHSFVSNYSQKQLLKNIKALVPIAEVAEIRAIAAMDENDVNAAQFFYNFWYNRNSSAPEKEWKVYADKLNYISKKYGRNGMPGFETDRGKLYLMFGEPNITEKRDNEQGSLPYEVWFYYETKGRKNVKFLFYQPGSISDQMIILHSSEQDILVNPYWKRVLLQDPTNGDNKLKYRVFEYFN